MAEQFSGTVEVLDDASTNVKITLDGDTALISIGGNGQDGHVVLKDSAGNDRILINAQKGTVIIKDTTNTDLFLVDGINGNITLGGTGKDGDIIVKSAGDKVTARLNGDNPDFVLYNPNDSVATITLGGRHGNLTLGGSGHDGDVTIKAAGDPSAELNDVTTIRINGDRPSMWMLNPDDGGTTIVIDGKHGNLSLGGSGHDGDITMKSPGDVDTVRMSGDRPNLLMVNPDDSVQTIALDGKHGNISLGGGVHDGDLTIKSSGDVNTIEMNGDRPSIGLRNKDDSVRTILLDGKHGNLDLGGSGHDGDITIKDSSDNTTIRLNGDTGDITLLNADFAEHFDVADGLKIEGGMIMTLNAEGKIQPSSTPYDKKVVGVIAGAGNYRPGIIMDSQADNSNRIPISVLGKVSCKAEAIHEPIEVGDILTTSSTMGHAMKASDPEKSFGSIIGKALSPLVEGVGFVDMLVTLQ